jgi:hypothetical protein
MPAFEGRLTLVSGKPVMDGDVTSSTLYYTHDRGNQAGGFTFTSELSVSLAGLPGNSIHKVFIGSAGIYLGSPGSGSLYGRGQYGAGIFPGHDPDPPLSRYNGVLVNSANDPYLGTIQIDPGGGTCTAHVTYGPSRWDEDNQLCRPRHRQGI